jgi:uncharacterized damage-inducible protein DinB
MNYAEELSRNIERTVSGPVWHGPALSELLDGVTSAQAAARPVPGAHSIWELVLHLSAWAEISRTRLSPLPTSEPTDDENFPPVAEPSAQAWIDSRARLETAYGDLANDVMTLDGATLARLASGRAHSVSEMLHGVIEHGAYHGGQIALLKRALSSS